MMIGYDLDEKSGFLGKFNIKSPSKLLKIGDVVELKHYCMFNSVNAAVIYANDHIIRIRALDNIPERYFFPQDPVVINFTASEELYVVGGDIESIGFLEPLEVTIGIHKIERLKDVRKHARHYVSLTGDVKSGKDEGPNFSIIKNISLGGVKLNCKANYLLEDTVDVNVRLDKATKFTFMGKVVRKNKISDMYEYGIEIFGITEQNIKYLHAYIDSF